MKEHKYAEGNKDSKIAFIGRDPGVAEEESGRPFQGGAGGVLDSLFKLTGINREEVYITNTFKERPPNNDVNYFYLSKEWTDKKGRKQICWTQDVKTEFQYHLENLREELSQLKNLNLLVCLGDDAFHQLYPLGQSISVMRGSLYETDFVPGKKLKIMGTYHPAALMRQPSLYPITQLDLLKAKREMETPNLPDQFRKLRVITQPLSIEEKKRILSLPSITCDVETNETKGKKKIENLFCVGFGFNHMEAISIPLTIYPTGESYWNHEQDKEMREFISQVLSSNIPKIFQYGIFDVQVLQKFGFQVNNFKYDTYQMIHCLHNGFPKGLDFLASVYSDIPYWKHLRTESLNAEDPTFSLNKYCAQDNAGTYEVAINLRKEMEKTPIPENYMKINSHSFNFWDFYLQHYYRLQPLIQSMNDHGLNVDVEKREKAVFEYTEKIYEKEEELFHLVEKIIEVFNDKKIKTVSKKPSQALLKQWKKEGIIQDITQEIPLPYHVSYPSKYETIPSKKRAKEKLFNPQSSDQMRRLLYEVLDIKPYKETSSDEKHLAKIIERKNISDFHRKVMETLLEIRGMSKIKTSYLESTLREGRFYSIYNMGGTGFGGRLAANQTIDKEGGSAQTFPREGIVKKTIIPDDEDHIFINIDLDRAELWPVAFLTENEAMIEALQGGKDLHCLNASLIFDIPYERLLEDHLAGKKPPERQKAKNSNHAMDYLPIDWYNPHPFFMPGGVVSRLCGISQKEGEEIVRKIHHANPNLDRWHKEVRNQIERNRTLYNFFGRRKTWYGTITNKTIQEACAYIPQSTIGDLMCQMLIQLFNHPLYKEWNLRIMQNGHDSTLLQAPRNITLDQINQIAKIMEYPLVYKNRTFIVPTSWEIGESWGELKTDKEWFKENR